MPIRERNLGKAMISDMIKAANIRDILLQLLIYKDTTKLDLALRTGLSITTVSECVNLLVKNRMLDICGTERSSGGRKPSIYRINPDFGYILGLRVRETRLNAAVLRMDGELIGSGEQAVGGGTPLLMQIEAFIETICGSRKDRHPLAIGISIPGSLDVENGVILQSDCDGWSSVHIKEILERHYSTAVYLDCGINCCAAYLHTLGEAKYTHNFICIMDDCPEKAALVIDGKVLRGRDNLCGTQGERIAAVADLLGLEAVLTDLPPETCPAPTPLYRQVPPVDVTLATALNAEIHWFDRAYDITRLEE